MPIISARDNENNRWKRNRKTKKLRQETTRGDRSYSQRVRAKWFCCAFRLGFLQLTCKTSLIFKSNLQLPLSIILKQRELNESKHVAVECRCLKIWDLLSLLICSSNLVLMTCFANIVRTTASKSKFLYQERFEIIRNWIFIWKIILNLE